MNTNQLKRFAKEARIKLLDQVGRKLEFVLNNSSQIYTDTYAAQIQSLKDKIQQTGPEQVIEMVAYTWFNRLMALRFMDANSYTLPKVVTPLPGMTNPEILQNALAGNIEPDLILDRQRINDLLDGRTSSTDAHTEAYKMLLVAVCNQWHKAMPFMFERISDYTELLLPDDLLSDYSIVADLRNGMSDDDCQQEEVLGWLYQFYISDENERLIKSKNVYKKHELAPASQLFTPKWIVRYMVDNTLGQLWSEINPSTKILSQLEFYIKPAYKEQLQPRAKKKLEDIKFFEPCVGSAHILSYAFDVFYLMYEEQGYNTSDIPELILKYNLFGIDIDERAAQIASFVLMMKGRRKNSRFLRKNIIPNITFYQDFPNDPKFKNAKAIGSLIQVEPKEIERIKIEEGSMFAESQKELKKLYTYLGQRYDCVVTNPPYISSSRMEGSLKQYVEVNYPDTKSDLFATFVLRCLELCNEDGLTGYMTPFVWMFISSYEKLRTCIIDKHFINNLIQLEYSGFDGATVPVCTFTLRNRSILESKGSYIRLSDFKGSENQAPKSLEAIKNPNCGWFYTAKQNEFEKIPGSPIGYWVGNKFLKIYSESKRTIGDVANPNQALVTGNTELYIRKWHETSINKIGFDFSSRESALKSGLKWFPYNKGGDYRNWYGNFDHIINWENDGLKLQTTLHPNGKRIWAHNFVLDSIFKEGIVWSKITSGKPCFRYSPSGYLYDDASGVCSFEEGYKEVLLGLLCSKVNLIIQNITNPTLNIQPANIRNVPIPNENSERITSVVNEIISLAKLEWDSREKSWNFTQNELVKQGNNILREAFIQYQIFWTSKFYEIYQLEVELNKIFINIYALQEILTPDVILGEITILQEELTSRKQKRKKADLDDESEDDESWSEKWVIVDNKYKKSGSDVFELPWDKNNVFGQFLNYSVGCMFGRYSLDKPGLILANQGETLQDCLTQIPIPSFLLDEENIIPVLDGEWFNDDIAGRFNEFLKVAFGKEHFEENLRFIEDTLGKDIRKYFVRDFYNDHIKRYKKRPIYWMFSSPKGHFKALIYMHRYQPDTCSRMLNEYLQTFIGKLESAKSTQTMFSLREDISGREKTLASKEIVRLEDMLKDCRKYESILFIVATQKIVIDLDDGVKVNYQKFKEVLVTIKGLEAEE